MHIPLPSAGEAEPVVRVTVRRRVPVTVRRAVVRLLIEKVDRERAVRTGAVSLGRKFLVKPQEFRFETE